MPPLAHPLSRNQYAPIRDNSIIGEIGAEIKAENAAKRRRYPTATDLLLLAPALSDGLVRQGDLRLPAAQVLKRLDEHLCIPLPFVFRLHTDSGFQKR